MDTRENSYQELFVNRIGSNEDAYMITTDLIRIFPKNSIIQLDKYNIIKTNKKIYMNIPKISSNEIPNFTIVKGIFEDTKIQNYAILNNNILGFNSIFYTNTANIQIPVINFSNELLQFFGCSIINENDVIELNNKIEMPFFKIIIGKNYKNDYLLKEGLGEGFYIENHDTPHIHQPLNNTAEGYLVLGKRIDNTLLLSKVRIPFGKALYTPPLTYHNDSLLIGEYNVLYNKTNNYQTYIFKTFDNKIVNII